MMNKKVMMGMMLGVASLFSVGMANAATVSFSPAATQVTSGDHLTLDLLGAGFVDGLYFGSVTINWDASLMTLNTTLAEINASTAALGYTDSFFSGFNSIDLVNGIAKIDFAAPLVGPAGPDFNFFSLDFTALDVVSPTPTFVTASLGQAGGWLDNNYNPIDPVNYASAAVVVNPVPVPAAIWLLGSGLLGLVGVARRRSAGLAAA